MVEVRLRDVSEDDLPIFFEHQRDPEANRMAGFAPRDRAAFMAHWRTKVLGDEGVIKKTVLFNEQVAGNVVCFEHDGRREVGYWIGREHWGRGVATRALQAFLDQVTERPLYAGVVKSNVASIRLLEKCGFTSADEDESRGREDGDELLLRLDRGSDNGPLTRGEDAMRAGDWSAAKVAFELALRRRESPAAHEGLGRALWWLRDIDGAISHVERAYAGRREAGDVRRAAADALWLAREFVAAYGNAAVSAGWHARAEGLLRDAGDVPENGWLMLTRAERSNAPTEMARHATEAVEAARGLDDADLEAVALVRLGYAEVAAGDVARGMAKVDEALAAATGGEVGALETIGDVICAGIAACELAADWQRIEQWGQAVQGWITSHDHVAVLGFCYACCAEMFIASGQWEMADGLLAEGLGAMQAAGLRARCVHPASKLAELRVTQGRLEEAEQLLAGFEELPESTHALASLYRSRGETAMAAAVLYRRLKAIGDDNVLAAPFLALLVDVQLTQGDADGADATAERLERVAARSSVPRIEAMAGFARGRVAAFRGDPDAPRILGSAISAFAAQRLPLDATRARFELARAREGAEPEVAVGEARTALAEFERLGAPRDADAAAAFLRERGVAGRTGPKGLGLLSKREREVLGLLGDGLTNAEIAARLFISTKTAGNHVSSVLSKLNLRSRTEAAAYSVRYLGAGTRNQK